MTLTTKAVLPSLAVHWGGRTVIVSPALDLIVVIAVQLAPFGMFRMPSTKVTDCPGVFAVTTKVSPAPDPRQAIPPAMVFLNPLLFVGSVALAGHAPPAVPLGRTQ